MQELKSVDSPASTTDDSPPQRPKRNSCQKSLGTNNGLLWREETDLKRALYASLQENKRRNLEDEELNEVEKEQNESQPVDQPANSRDASPKRTKVHAQRKFAQCSTPNSPLPTPVKVNNVSNPTSELLPCRRPKTEDFLTFLCLRGTTILPPSLDFLNICSKSDTSSDSRCNSPELEAVDLPVASSVCRLETRIKGSVKGEPCKSDVVKKSLPCKANASRPRAETILKATNGPLSHPGSSRTAKEVSRKRRSVDDGSDSLPRKILSVGASKTESGTGRQNGVNGRSRCSMKALREKYKQKRLAANHNKRTTSSGGNSQRNANKVKNVDTPLSQVTTRNSVKNLRTSVLKNSLAQREKKLALEKRKSLRSAKFGRKRPPLPNKSSTWLRKAKLVPPVVDVDSESEPEVVSVTSPSLACRAPQDSEASVHVTRQVTRNLSGRLKRKQTVPIKSQKEVSPRFLRHRNDKNPVIRHKLKQSKAITRLPSRIDKLRKIKKGLASYKTMSLRNDPQISKPMTRSASKLPIELSPRRRTRLTSTFSRRSSKGEEKQLESVEQKVSLRPKPNAHKQEHSTKGECERRCGLCTRSQKDPVKTNTTRTKEVPTSKEGVGKNDLNAARKEGTRNRSLCKTKRSLGSRNSTRVVAKRSASSSDEDKPLAKALALKSPKFKEEPNVPNVKQEHNGVKAKDESKCRQEIGASKSRQQSNATKSKQEGSASKIKLESVKSKHDIHPLKRKQEVNTPRCKLESSTSKNKQETTKFKQESHLSKPKELSVPKPKQESTTLQLSQETSEPKKENSKAKEQISIGEQELGVSQLPHGISTIKTLQETCTSIAQQKAASSRLQKELNTSKCESGGDGASPQQESAKSKAKHASDVSRSDPELDVGRSSQASHANQDANKSKAESKLNRPKRDQKHSTKISKTKRKEEHRNTKAAAEMSTSLESSGEESDFTYITINPICDDIEESISNVVEIRNSISPNKSRVTHDHEQNVTSEVSSKNKNDSNNEAELCSSTLQNSRLSQSPEALLTAPGNVPIVSNTLSTTSQGHIVNNLVHAIEAQVQKSVEVEEDHDLHSTAIYLECQQVGDVYRLEPNAILTQEHYVNAKFQSECVFQSTQCMSACAVSLHGQKPGTNKFVEFLKEKLQQDARDREMAASLENSQVSSSAACSLERAENTELAKDKTKADLSTNKKLEKDTHKSTRDGEKKTHKSGKSSLKDSGKTKKKSDKEHHKMKKEGDKDGSKSKEGSKSSKKDDKDSSKIHKKDSKQLSKALKKEHDKEHSKSHKKDSSKEKSKCEESGKTVRRDSDKDSSKSSKKESDRDSSFSEKVSSNKSSSSESKKDKSSKKLSLKKKKKREHKNFDKITKSFLFSDTMKKHTSFKEYKRRSSSEKSQLKKLLSKSKKRKKLELLKAKKLSKKLSSKLLRKYAKKKGLKLKKNKLKLKKKELKKEGSGSKSSSQGDKYHHKTKKQKHKNKSDHHKKEGQDKNSASLSSTKVDNTKEDHKESSSLVKVSNAATSTGMGDNVISSVVASDFVNTLPSSSYGVDNLTETAAAVNSLSSETPQGDMVFSNSDEIQNLVTTDFSGVFEEAFTSGTILLTTRETIAQVPVHFIQDIALPKTMADAATNTSEDDLLDNVNACPEVGSILKSEEMSVGTQTITPAGSPAPVFELRTTSTTTSSLLVTHSCEEKESSPAPLKSKCKPTHKDATTGSTQTVSPMKRRKSFSLTSLKKSRSFDIQPTAKEQFPGDAPCMVDAPVYKPSLAEFQDPLEYIAKIQPDAEKYGICKIIPPASFKPDCKVNDDMRFTAHNQYVHKMLSRWGPNVQQVACFKKHLKSQGVQLDQAPLIGGIELDLSKFYQTVQQLGGLQQVIEKKKWQRVADSLHIPKAAQDRVTKLYDAYCKYLVSYETLPPEEKKKLEDEVISEHENRLRMRNSSKEVEKEECEDAEDEENTDCVTKGRSTTLSNFFRVARNTMSMWHKNETTPEEVEHEFWKLVTDRVHHVVVHAGNIDSSVYQSGFPSSRSSPFAKHPWNLKVLTNNSNSILRCMGPVSGVTIPTLHVGMLYTAGCWYRDPHSLPWIEYLHTGASKIWYSVPPKRSGKFRDAMMKIMPEYCGSNPVWLASDTAMVPPDLLVKNGASLSRTIQHSGQFIVIFPESFTSTICSGYSVSESVYFAPPSWLDLAVKAFQDIRDSCEPPAFSLERLLFCIANDSRILPETLQKILPMIGKIREEELSLRKQLDEAGLNLSERLPLVEVRDKKKKSRGIDNGSEKECEICRTHCYVSMVFNPQDETIYCLPHAMEHIPKKDMKSCKLLYTYDETQLNDLVQKTSELMVTVQKPTVRKKSPKKKATTSLKPDLVQLS